MHGGVGQGTRREKRPFVACSDNLWPWLVCQWGECPGVEGERVCPFDRPG